METFAAPSIARHARISLKTERATEFIDITERVQAFATGTGIQTGLVNIQSLHTTSAVVLQEDEPLLLKDFTALLDRTAPAEAVYCHDDLSVRTVNLTPEERVNGHAHCRALVLTTSCGVNIVNGRLELGFWQRIFLVELDGPRTRDLSLVAIGEAAR